MKEARFSVSPSALSRIRVLLREEKTLSGFRIFVESGGCHGFQYHFAVDDKVDEVEDYIIEMEDVIVLIDQTSYAFLEGSELDYKEEMIGAHFFIKNPNAHGSCGCGNSFSIQ